MDRMPEVGDIIRYNGDYEDDTWRVAKVRVSDFDGYYVGKNQELLAAYGQFLAKDLNADLSKWEYVEDELTRYVKSVRAEAGIVDDRS